MPGTSGRSTESTPSPWRTTPHLRSLPLLSLALLAVLLSHAAPLAAQAPAACGGEGLARLSVGAPWQGSLAPGEARCLAVELARGEVARMVVAVEAARPYSAGASIRVVGPADTVPVLQVGLGNVSSRAVTWEAAEAGTHHVVLGDAWELAAGVTAIPARALLEAVESPARARARREALAADPRVAWLAAHAVPIRTLDFHDEDLSDLEPLRASLQGVRVVLLGESTHFSGADFQAFSRLVKFLHQELGFDVLALEAGMYGMQVAWDSMRAGAPPREAFLRGAMGFLSESEQMQPLIAYLGEQARGEAPLELAGFDNRPWLFWPHWSVSTDQFAHDLARALTTLGIPGPLADAASPQSAIMASLATRRFFQQPPPEKAERDGFLAEVDAAVARLAAHPSDDAPFWAEALRGVGCHAREVFLTAGATRPELAPACLRDHQMTRHLLWLANERYPDRKVIAWTHSGHAMRTAELPQVGGTGPSLGHGVHEALGREAYVIGTASYRSSENLIVPDQDPRPEFEELMDAAGFDHGFVDLRAAATAGAWPGGPFLARPSEHQTREAVWSEVVDALLFIRVQERSRPLPRR